MQNTPQLSAEMEKRFDDWFSQFTRPYEEYEKNKEKLWEMLGVVGEKEAPMEIIARLEEIKRLRKMQYLFKKHFLATALEEQKKEATFTLVNTTKPFFYAGYEAGKKDERQKVLSEVEGWMVELRKQAGLCNDAANSHLEQQRASRLVEMICDIVAKLEEMKK